MDLTSNTYYELMLNNEVNKCNFSTGYITLSLEKGEKGIITAFDLTTFISYIIYNNYTDDNHVIRFNLLPYNAELEENHDTIAYFENYEILYIYRTEVGDGGNNTKLCLQYMSNISEESRFENICILGGKLY